MLYVFLIKMGAEIANYKLRAKHLRNNTKQVSNATKVASVSPTPTKPALVQQSFLLRKQQSGDASNSGGEMSEQSDVTNNATSTANNSADNISGLSKKSSSATQLSMTGKTCFGLLFVARLFAPTLRKPISSALGKS